MLSVLDACDCWDVMVSSGECDCGVIEIAGLCYVQVSRVILCHRSQVFLELIRYRYPVGTFWCGMCLVLSTCCSASIWRSSFSFFWSFSLFLFFRVFSLFGHLHRMEASFQNDLSAVVPVVMLGFGSMASHTVLELCPCSRLMHPMLCCCVVLGCENGVWASFMSPPSCWWHGLRWLPILVLWCCIFW
jgi:hypothetical protein